MNDRPPIRRRKALIKRSTNDVSPVRVRTRTRRIPYEDNLLERARVQWQFGDWANLARLERSTLQHHPDRAKLALLVGAARLQIGQFSEARDFIRLAQEWGVNRLLVCRILAAGVYNSLGRAAAIGCNLPRALKHFESSISVGTPEAEKVLLTNARVNQQYGELGLPLIRVANNLDVVRATHNLVRKDKGPSVAQLAMFELGDAWAGNTINTVIFRHHGILSCQGKQTTAFYVDVQTLRIVQRDLATDDITAYDLSGNYNLFDAHNTISIGVDRANHLHICYDHHATQLRYRRSTRPNDILEWTEELPMTGVAEEKVTYPTFIQPRENFPLTLLYRDGGHDKGTARLKTFDELSGRWSDHSIPILSGSESKPWTSNAYWNHPAIGSDGSFHLSFVWRTHTLGEEERINNINIGYACSHDNGKSWVTSKGRSYQLPITQVNAETVFPVSPGSNLINQCGMALDSSNNPHIVFYADDTNGIPQYQHLRYDGKIWHHRVISRRAEPFTLKGVGTLRIPLSRPEIIIDNEDNAYVITRGDHSHGRMVVTLLAAPDYTYFSDNDRVIWSEDLGSAETVIDRGRWARDNVLTLLLQHNEQPDHDIGHQSVVRPIRLLDVQLKSSQE